MPQCLHLGSVLVAGLVEVATIMLVRLYPDLLWDILSWLDAEDIIRLRMVRPMVPKLSSVCHFIICAERRLVKLSASKRTNVSCGSVY